MLSHENLVLSPSAYYNFYPSTMAKEALLHVMCIGDFRYAAGYDLSRTSFDSFLLEIILEGRVKIETEGELLTAHTGQVVLLDCYKPHRYYSDTGWHALWVHFDGASARGYFEIIRRQNGQVFATHQMQTIRKALQDLYDMFHHQQPLNEAYMALHLTQALTAMTDPAEPTVIRDQPRLIDQAVAFINQHMGDEIYVRELARMVGLSEYHFIRVFREAMGVTPRQYIIASRMNHARYLLKTTALPIGEIAGMAGYTSESMFTAAFRRTQGTTPSQYRHSKQA